MCGIVGFIGKEEAAPILLDGLSRLEYRGYDSAGLAVYGEDNGVRVVKTKGRLQALFDLTQGGATLHGAVGLPTSTHIPMFRSAEGLWSSTMES